MATCFDAPAKALTYVHPGTLKPYSRNARVHSKTQIRQIAASDLSPENWSEIGEKFSVSFSWSRLREFLDEGVEVQRAADRIHITAGGGRDDG